jgi:hypothetical protein
MGYVVLLVLGSVGIGVTLTQVLLLAPLDWLHNLLQLPWGIAVLILLTSWLLGE